MMAILSCTYDYQYPDYTGAKYRYKVADISSEVKQQLLPIAMECGVTLQYASEQWRIVVTEKDAAGNILYQGEPRDRTDNNTKFWKYHIFVHAGFKMQIGLIMIFADLILKRNIQ